MDSGRTNNYSNNEMRFLRNTWTSQKENDEKTSSTNLNMIRRPTGKRNGKEMQKEA